MEQTSNFVLYLSVYSFLGWACESAYCSILAKKWVNRGFLNGPFCPIYGFGALLVLSFLLPLKSNFFLLYVAGVICTSVLEFLTSVAMEKIFHCRWWDYSDHRFNIQGRVCLENSLMFGGLCLVVVYGIHPAVSRFVENLPLWGRRWVSSGLLIYFAVDLSVTIRSIIKLSDRLEKIHQLQEALRDRVHQENLHLEYWTKERISQLRELDGEELERYLRGRLKELVEDNRLTHRRLMEAFPEMDSGRWREAIARVRNSMEHRRNNRPEEE